MFHKGATKIAREDYSERSVYLRCSCNMMMKKIFDLKKKTEIFVCMLSYFDVLRVC